MKNVNVVVISSIYGTGKKILPPHMAWLCEKEFKSPAGDMISVVQSFYRIVFRVKALGGHIIVSDMFRSHDMQRIAHQKKPRLALAPGRSLHEAGLAFDFDVSALGIPYSEFEKICKSEGWETGRGWRKSEPWHVQLKPAVLGFRSISEAISFVGNKV